MVVEVIMANDENATPRSDNVVDVFGSAAKLNSKVAAPFQENAPSDDQTRVLPDDSLAGQIAPSHGQKRPLSDDSVADHATADAPATKRQRVNAWLVASGSSFLVHARPLGERAAREAKKASIAAAKAAKEYGTRARVAAVSATKEYGTKARRATATAAKRCVTKAVAATKVTQEYGRKAAKATATVAKRCGTKAVAATKVTKEYGTKAGKATATAARRCGTKAVAASQVAKEYGTKAGKATATVAKEYGAKAAAATGKGVKNCAKKAASVAGTASVTCHEATVTWTKQAIDTTSQAAGRAATAWPYSTSPLAALAQASAFLSEELGAKATLESPGLTTKDIENIHSEPEAELAAVAQEEVPQETVTQLSPEELAAVAEYLGLSALPAHKELLEAVVSSSTHEASPAPVEESPSDLKRDAALEAQESLESHVAIVSALEAQESLESHVALVSDDEDVTAATLAPEEDEYMPSERLDEEPIEAAEEEAEADNLNPDFHLDYDEAEPVMHEWRDPASGIMFYWNADAGAWTQTAGADDYTEDIYV